jgi:hypothetical protein
MILENLNKARLHTLTPPESKKLTFDWILFKKFPKTLSSNISSTNVGMPYFQTKRVCNPDRNGWNRATTRATVSGDGLRACSSDIMTYIYAEKGFPISGKHYRVDSFPGTIIYYYEVKLLYKSYSL